MDACRHIVTRLLYATVFAVVLGGGLGFAAEPGAGIRLPAWIELSESDDAVTASYNRAPRPRVEAVYSSPVAVELPFREPRQLKTTGSEPNERLIRQLENAASGARTTHALGRLIRRYGETRQKLETDETDKGDEKLLARADRLGAWAYESRGRLRAANGDYDKATDDYRNALLLDDKNEGARHALAVSLAEDGNLRGALEEFSQLLLTSPHSIAARRNRAQLHLGRDRPDSAIADLDAALDQSPASEQERADLLRLRGEALHAAGRLRAAARDLNEAIRLDARNPAAYMTRGHVFAEGGFYEQAISDYSAALSADSQHVDSYRSLAWVLATCPENRLRNPATAIEASWRARRLLGYDDFLTLDAAAAAHASAGDYAEAVRLQQRALVATEAPPADANERLGLYQAGRPYVAK